MYNDGIIRNRTIVQQIQLYSPRIQNTFFITITLAVVATGSEIYWWSEIFSLRKITMPNSSDDV